MWRAQQIAQQEQGTDKGYAMMMTSLLSIVMFSLLAAYMTMSNLSKSASTAYTKSSSTFYAAESGLNARAQLIRDKVGTYTIPSGVSAANMADCASAAPGAPIQYSATNDFGCRNYSFDSASGTSSDRVTSNNGSSLAEQRTIADSYVATTYVANNPDRLAVYPRQAPIPAGQLFEGMNMLEYTHRVYSNARIQTAGTLSAPEQTVLQLDFQTRFIPMFQFAAFYDQDLEITPGPTMYINGRVHTNGNLHLAGGNPLCLAGQVSAQGGIYNRRKHAGNGGEQSDNGNVYIYPSAVNCNAAMTQLPANKLTNTVSYTAWNDPLTIPAGSSGSNFDSTNRANMLARFGSNVTDRVNNIRVPAPDFLARMDDNSEFSVYYSKADLRIETKSNPAANAIPFSLTSLATGISGGTGAGCVNVAADRVGAATLTCTTFAAGQLHSLRQPVLVRTAQTIDDTALCTQEVLGVTAAPISVSLNPNRNRVIVRALQTAMVSQRSLVNYGNIGSGPAPSPTAPTLSTFPTIRTLFRNNLTAAGLLLTPADLGILDNSTFASIAKLATNSCFKPAPIQTYNTFYNNRERTNLTTNANNGNIEMLQTNIESLTIWNRDGLYVDLQVDGNGDPQLVSSDYQVTGNNGGQGIVAREKIFQIAPIPASMTTCIATDNLCRTSFRHLGFASADTGETGLAVHLSVDSNNTPGTNTPYPAKKSPYGFAITDASQLPGPLTIATDQAAYIQGDYNFNAGTGVTGNSINRVSGTSETVAALSHKTVGNGGYKLPASILADSLNVTSRQCLDTNATTGLWRLNCGLRVNPGSPIGTVTTVNAAFLGGTDIRPFSNANDYSGGLHNYPRFHEQWGGPLNYRGSFVSLGAALQVSGTWSQQIYAPPTRNWDFDADFNDVANLPPLSPNIVYLKQKVFSRGYSN